MVTVSDIYFRFTVGISGLFLEPELKAVPVDYAAVPFTALAVKNIKGTEVAWNINFVSVDIYVSRRNFWTETAQQERECNRISVF